jgi:hypothetical protein
MPLIMTFLLIEQMSCLMGLFFVHGIALHEHFDMYFQ